MNDIPSFSAPFLPRGVLPAAPGAVRRSTRRGVRPGSRGAADAELDGKKPQSMQLRKNSTPEDRLVSWF